MPDDDGSPSAKKARTDDLGAAELAAATTGSTLNYTGTNLAIPLSLSMKEATKPPAKKKAPKDGKEEEEELNCEGLPPNATDEEGNVLVTDYDILCGRGGLTNHVSFRKHTNCVHSLSCPGIAFTHHFIFHLLHSHLNLFVTAQGQQAIPRCRRPTPPRLR
jgi:hypothetical protein